jgi:hypothetical protein
MISNPFVQELIKFVEEGGTLVTEARCGWIDEKGFSYPVIPGGGLDKFFGCREARLLPIQKTGKMVISRSHPALPWLKPGNVLDSLFFGESFEIENNKAQVLATGEDGQPMIVLAPFGKGQAMIVGSFVGSAYHHFRNVNNGKFMAGLADWLGIKSAAEVKTLPEEALVELRWLEGPDYWILFAFNQGEREARSEVSLSLPWPKVEIKNLETEEKVAFGMDGNKVSLNLKLEPQNVWVFLIKKS